MIQMSNPRLKNDLYDDFMVKYNDDKDSTKSRKTAAEEFFTELSTNEKYRDWKIVDVNDKNDGDVGDFFSGEKDPISVAYETC